jgi:competence protein ComEC
MTTCFRLTPVLSAALGAVGGYYCICTLLPIGVFAVLFASVAVLCFFRVLASLESTVNGAAVYGAAVYGASSRSLQLAAMYSAAFAAGLFLGICAARAGRNEIYFGIPEQKVVALKGVLIDDPRKIKGGRIMAVLSLRECAGPGGLRVKSKGEIPIFFPAESAERLRGFGRGTTVFTEGKLHKSSMSLSNGVAKWTYSSESTHIVKPASAMERFRTSVRLNLIARFSGSSWGGLALALLLGIRDNLDVNLATMYRNAGCSYILALSGMHLAVLASLIALILKKPLGLKAAAVTSALIIIIYYFIVGPLPSLSRATLMYLLGILAVLGFFPKEPLSILSLSFLLQIVISPASGNSISFILSYLALTGILVVGQPLYSLLSGKMPDFLARPLTASCGAFIATAGVTSFSFGVLAPVGILAGLVLVPLTTIFMIGSIIWLVLDMFSLSRFLSVPLSIIYQVMEKTASLATTISGISPRPAMIITLSIILSLFIVLFERRRRMAAFALNPFG